MSNYFEKMGRAILRVFKAEDIDQQIPNLSSVFEASPASEPPVSYRDGFFNLLFILKVIAKGEQACESPQKLAEMATMLSWVKELSERPIGVAQPAYPDHSIDADTFRSVMNTIEAAYRRGRESGLEEAAKAIEPTVEQSAFGQTDHIRKQHADAIRSIINNPTSTDA